MKDYKKYKKARKENNLAKIAQVSGAGAVTVGGGALVAKKILDNKVAKITKESLIKSGDKIPEVFQKASENSKALKKIGAVALPAGVALTVGGTILKKKSDKKLKEYRDDNKKK